MSTSLINAQTADTYVGAGQGGAELLCPSAAVIVLTVANAAVLVQYGQGAGVPAYEQTEHPLFPGVWTIPRSVQPILDAVRARSLAQGVPARVSASGY
jgi:hypothetical protein